MSTPLSTKSIVLFDVDGTLTLPRKCIQSEFRSWLLKVLAEGGYQVGLVGGSDLAKISEQIGGPSALSEFDYVFAENGLVALKKGEIFAKQSIVEYLGEERLQTFLNGCLEYLSQVRLPVKRGTFIEYRTGLINISPIGRNCSQEERDNFLQYDDQHHVRKQMVSFMKEKFHDFPLEYAIGGQISIDVYPIGWNKSYCLKFLEDYKSIFFYGDKCFSGGNDFEIFSHPAVKGFQVEGPEDTKRRISQLVNIS